MDSMYDLLRDRRSDALSEWAVTHDIEREFIQPGKPQQNASVERYHRTLRAIAGAVPPVENIERVLDYTTHW